MNNKGGDDEDRRETAAVTTVKQQQCLLLPPPPLPSLPLQLPPIPGTTVILVLLNVLSCQLTVHL